MKPKYAIIDFGMFKNEVLVALNCNYDQLLQWVTKNADKLYLATVKDEDNALIIKNGSGLTVCQTFSHPKHYDQTRYIIWLRSLDMRSNYDISVLFHEITHLSQFFLPKVLDRNKEIEAEAYFVGYVAKQIMDIVRPRRVK